MKLTSVMPTKPSEAIAVAGFAQDFVFTYLTSSGEDAEEQLLPYLGYAPSLAGMEPGKFYVTHLATRDIRAVESEWIVTIRADLLEHAGHGYQRSDPLWFSVPVTEDENGGFRALSLPVLARIPPTDPLSPRRSDSLHADQGDTNSIAALITWYLTESAPSRGRMPAGGFATTELMSLRLDNDAGLAGVNATTPMGHVLRLNLWLERVEGTWRVTEPTRPPS